jgi:hypothetical protein
VKISSKNVSRLESDVALIRRLVCLGARNASIATRFKIRDGAESLWKANAIAAVTLDETGKKARHGRPTKPFAGRMTRDLDPLYETHQTLALFCERIALEHALDDSVAKFVMAHEAYRFLVANLGLDALISAEDPVVGDVDTGSLKFAMCVSCRAPRTILYEQLSGMYRCFSCGDSELRAKRRQRNSKSD